MVIKVLTVCFMGRRVNAIDLQAITNVFFSGDLSKVCHSLDSQTKPPSSLKPLNFNQQYVLSESVATRYHKYLHHCNCNIRVHCTYSVYNL